MHPSPLVLALPKCRWADEQKGKENKGSTESESGHGVVVQVAPVDTWPRGAVLSILCSLLDEVQSIWGLNKELEYLLGQNAWWETFLQNSNFLSAKISDRGLWFMF